MARILNMARLKTICCGSMQTNIVDSSCGRGNGALKTSMSKEWSLERDMSRDQAQHNLCLLEMQQPQVYTKDDRS